MGQSTSELKGTWQQYSGGKQNGTFTISARFQNVADTSHPAGHITYISNDLIGLGSVYAFISQDQSKLFFATGPAGNAVPTAATISQYKLYNDLWVKTA